MNFNKLLRPCRYAFAASGKKSLAKQPSGEQKYLKQKRGEKMNGMTTRLAGVSYGAAQENIKTFGCPDIGSYELVRDPKNPHDKNAIRVVIGKYFMGYIPKDIAKVLAPLMDDGRRFLAEFVRRNEHPYHDTVGLTVRIVCIAPS